MKCESCNKEIFLSETLALNAAQLYNWIFGKEYNLYRCPVTKTDFHLSTMRWRRGKGGMSRPLRRRT